MNSRPLVWIGTIVGSLVGSYVPVLWGAGMLSLSSVIFGAVGAVVGIYIGFKMSS